MGLNVRRRGSLLLPQSRVSESVNGIQPTISHLSPYNDSIDTIFLSYISTVPRSYIMTGSRVSTPKLAEPARPWDKNRLWGLGAPPRAPWQTGECPLPTFQAPVSLLDWTELNRIRAPPLSGDTFLQAWCLSSNHAVWLYICASQFHQIGTSCTPLSPLPDSANW